MSAVDVHLRLHAIHAGVAQTSRVRKPENMYHAMSNVAALRVSIDVNTMIVVVME